jgi:hypothetical protein
MKPVRFYPEAEAEMMSAARFYEAQQKDLGKRFLSIQDALHRIQVNPLLYQEIEAYDDDGNNLILIGRPLESSPAHTTNNENNSSSISEACLHIRGDRTCRQLSVLHRTLHHSYQYVSITRPSGSDSPKCFTLGLGRLAKFSHGNHARSSDSNLYPKRVCRKSPSQSLDAPRFA